MGPSPPLTGCPAARGLLIPREAPEEVGGGPAAAVAAAAGGRQVAVSMAHLSPRKCEVNVDYAPDTAALLGRAVMTTEQVLGPYFYSLIF